MSIAYFTSTITCTQLHLITAHWGSDIPLFKAVISLFQGTDVFDNMNCSYSTSQALLITKANSTKLKFFMDSYHWQAIYMLEAPYNLKFYALLSKLISTL